MLADLKFAFGDIQTLLLTLESSHKPAHLPNPAELTKVAFKAVTGLGINPRPETADFVKKVNSLGISAAGATERSLKIKKLPLNVKLSISKMEVPETIDSLPHLGNLLQQVEQKFKMTLKQLANYAEERAGQSAAHQMVEHPSVLNKKRKLSFRED